jgi:two-component system, chemotaxis family, sensor kinase CheA
MEDDSILHMFLEDTREHLADIETDLLDIEEAGADFDPELVNKVFRTAHSIKGSAGFLNLDNVRDLSHKIENVLDMVRNREIVPTPEVVSVILAAFDKLEDLVENIHESEQMDISEHVETLRNLVTANLPEEQKKLVTSNKTLGLPGGRDIFTISEHDLKQARKGGNYIYLVEYDLIHDVHKQGKTPLDLMRFLEKSGLILDCRMDISQVGDLDQDLSNRIPFHVLYATILEPDLARAIFQVEPQYIHDVEEQDEREAAQAQSETPAELPRLGREVEQQSLDDLERQLNEALAGAGAGAASVSPPQPHPSLTAAIRNRTRPLESEQPEQPEATDESFVEDVRGFQLSGTAGQATLLLSGQATIERGMDMKEALLSGLDRTRALTVDLGQVAQADLALLQLLIAAKRSAKARGQSLSIAPGIAEPVATAAKRAGLDPRLEPAMERLL